MRRVEVLVEAEGAACGRCRFVTWERPPYGHPSCLAYEVALEGAPGDDSDPQRAPACLAADRGEPRPVSARELADAGHIGTAVAPWPTGDDLVAFLDGLLGRGGYSFQFDPPTMREVGVLMAPVGPRVQVGLPRGAGAREAEAIGNWMRLRCSPALEPTVVCTMVPGS